MADTKSNGFYLEFTKKTCAEIKRLVRTLTPAKNWIKDGDASILDMSTRLNEVLFAPNMSWGQFCAEAEMAANRLPPETNREEYLVCVDEIRCGLTIMRMTCLCLRRVAANRQLDCPGPGLNEEGCIKDFKARRLNVSCDVLDEIERIDAEIKKKETTTATATATAAAPASV